MAQLITVPTFTFNQGDVFSGEGNTERPIHVDFYNSAICFRQDGDYDQQEEIIISPEHIKAFFKEVLKHLPEALKHLDK